jgi:hypothetical protein
MSPSPRSSRIAGLVAGPLALLALAGCLAGCQVSSDNVSCSGASCSVTLTGNGAKATVLGKSLAFAGTSGGRAELSVGDAQVSCTQGQSVSAGPLRLACTTVTDDSVELTASLG